jgi:tungstate transport system ATP-binding protein
VKLMLHAENLRLTLSGRDIFQVRAFQLHQGEVLALVGPNGAGKSSLLLTLALLLKPTAGVIHVDGQQANAKQVLALRRRMAVVFQEPLLLATSVLGNVLTALRIRRVGRREAVERAQQWLGRLGVAHLARKPAHTLSGGEAQRVSLARAFALEPEILFMDEPFSALDYPTRSALLVEMGQLLRDMRVTTLFVTHDYSEIPYLAERVAVMYEGRIIKYGTITEVFGEDFLERQYRAPWET